jgi:hypothetical protein
VVEEEEGLRMEEEEGSPEVDDSSNKEDDRGIRDNGGGAEVPFSSIRFDAVGWEGD